MQLDRYSVYSKVSSANCQANEDLEKVLDLVDKFSKIRTVDKAKEFLRNTFLINDVAYKLVLGANNNLYIKETDKKFVVRISYTANDENECVIYNFKK